MKNAVAFIKLLLTFSLVVSACSQPKSETTPLLQQAKTAYEKGEFVVSERLTQQLLDLDDHNEAALFLVGQIAAQRKEYQKAAQAFARALALKPEYQEARLALAALLLTNGQYDQARAQIEQALSIAPGDFDALLVKSRLLIAQKMPDQAESILLALKDSSKISPDIYLLLASAKVQQNDSTGAEKALQDGIAKYPQVIALHLNLVRLYNETHRRDEATQALRRIIELEPDNIIYHLALATLFWEDQKRESAEKILAEIIDADPRKADRRIRVADFYLKHKQGEKAEQTLKEAVAKLPKNAQVHLALSRYYRLAGQLPTATEILTAFLAEEQKPVGEDLQAVHLALSRIYFQRRNIAEAIRYNELVLADNPDHLDAIFLKGRIEAARGALDQAASAYKAVVSKKPDLIEGYLQLAQVYMAAGNPPSAVSILKQGIGVLPVSKKLHLALARALLAHKDYKTAEAELLRVLEIDPADFMVQAELGDFYVQLEDERQARREYAEIISKFPDKAMGYIKSARLYQRQGDMGAAIAELQKGYTRNLRSVELLSELVQFNVLAGKPDAAIEICKARLTQNAQDAVAHYLIGQVHVQQKHYREAEKALLKAVQAAPKWINPANQLSALMLKAGRKSEAIRNLEAGLSQNPRNPAAYLTLARLSEEAGDVKKAVEIYERGLANIADFTDANKRLSILLSQQEGDEQAMQRALGLALLAYRQSPGRADIQDTLGWMFHRHGNDDKARLLLEKAVEQAPQSPLANYHLAMVLLKAGETESARRRLEASLSNESAFLGRANAEKALRDLKDAG